jgi:HK97 family phage portal protein
MSVSAFYAGVRLISETLGALPVFMYQRTPRGKKRVPNHPLHDTLHDQPNPFQTAQEWKEMMAAHSIMRGEGFSRKVPGDAGDNSFRLIPLNPSRVVMRMTGEDRIVYTWTRANGEKVPLLDNEVFRVRAFSDGVRGLGVVGLARETLGLALAEQEHGARFFSNSASPAGAIRHPLNVSADAQERFEEHWKRTYSGVENANSILVLEEGMEWQALGISNEDSQFLESRKFEVVEIARWLRLPPHMLGHMDNAIKANVEEQSRSFLLFSLFPWVKRFEHAFRRDLIVAKKTFFAEFNLDALMRADFKTRMASYQIAINNGIFSPNEVRELENRNSYRGGDEFFMPMNMRRVGRSDGGEPPDMELFPAPAPSAEPVAAPAESSDDSSRARSLIAGTEHQYVLGVMDRALALLPEQARISNPPPASERLHAIVESAADRIVHKEIMRITEKAPAYASNSKGWRKWVKTFYSDHAGYVSDVLAIDRDKAQEYCDGQREDVLTHGVQALDRWRYESPLNLVTLAMEEEVVS